MFGMVNVAGMIHTVGLAGMIHMADFTGMIHMVDLAGMIHMADFTGMIHMVDLAVMIHMAFYGMVIMENMTLTVCLGWIRRQLGFTQCVSDGAYGSHGVLNGQPGGYDLHDLCY